MPICSLGFGFSILIRGRWTAAASGIRAARASPSTVAASTVPASSQAVRARSEISSGRFTIGESPTVAVTIAAARLSGRSCHARTIGLKG